MNLLELDPTSSQLLPKDAQRRTLGLIFMETGRFTTMPLHRISH